MPKRIVPKPVEDSLRSLNERLAAAILRRDRFAQAGDTEAAKNVGGFIEWYHDRIATLRERYGIEEGPP